MPSDPEGLAIARERIAEAKEKRTGFLDLGRLGLTELPEELFELEHLWGLNLGSAWRDEQGKWHDAASDLDPNQDAHQLIHLQRFPGLRLLSVCETDICDLSPLAGLSALQAVDCSGTQVSDLGPLTGLSALRSFRCSSTPVSDLGPLAGLSSLQALSCFNTPVSDLGPLAGLSSLRSLDCSMTQVSDLGPLASLSTLRSLNCSATPVSDLGPLTGLSALQLLHCSNTQVSDLGPLAGLSALQSLDCSGTPVSDLGPLAGLSSLRLLHCSNTQVSDLGPLAALSALGLLNCSNSPVSDLPGSLVWLGSLVQLFLFNTHITDIPAEVLSPHASANCLERLRAHLRDLEVGEERLPDVKVLVLGNGRIGKTQICRRLRGEAFDPSVDSTHGILVTSAPLPMPPQAIEASHPGHEEAGPPSGPGEEARLHLWDFGGQDLYHGTHALFMRTQSIFVLVWTPQSENAREYEHGGMTFQNHPLAYWLEYVRHLSGVNSPVLIVQNQCDQATDEELRPPVEDETLGDFKFRKVLHYSALKDRGRGALNEALQQAILWLRETMGQARIGKGRMKVKRKLEALRDGDATLPAEERKYRWLTWDFFHQLCTEAGGVSSPELLLDYLHHTGIVFYQKGLFDDRIVLDQSWALEAVYAVFHREKCYRQLQRARGRFIREDLEERVWSNYGIEEQELFLSMMKSCGICFVHRKGDQGGKLETEFIAPDLLPDRGLVEAEIEAMWGEHEPGGDLVVELPFLHPGVMRGIISRLGQEAGISAVYWKDGVCLYERTTRSHALIEQRLSDKPNTWSGQIAVSARGGQEVELLGRLQEWIEKEIQRSGCLVPETKGTSDALHPAHPKISGPGHVVWPEGEDAAPERKLEFTPPPSNADEYCVSYGWKNKESMALVDRLCQEADRRGKSVLRDRTGVGLGDRFSRFMQRLGSGNRVFVILSKEYLESANCMFELFEVWRNSKMVAEEFLRRIAVLCLPDAKIMGQSERDECDRYWEDELRKQDQRMRNNPRGVSTQDFDRYRSMRNFAHHLREMLALIADSRQPQNFDEWVKYGFGDEIPPSPSK
ncbi:MAG: leucine-rich repeat domain-containing protein [Isosphaeraceae bacterium]